LKKSDNLLSLLSEGDLRTIGNNKLIISKIHSQDEFDELFNYMFHKNRMVVMRTADAIEKITRKNPSFLTKHKKDIITLATVDNDKELKWHLAQLVIRLTLSKKEIDTIWNMLYNWAIDNQESKIVRVNCIESLFHLANLHPFYKLRFEELLSHLKSSGVPSILARIKKISIKK
jgi:hypothetical protein